MESFSAISIAVLAVIISAHNIIIPVKGQCTVEGCESGDTSISIATEIRQLFAEFHERLQAIDRCSQEQVQGIYEFLNMSFQQMKSQQDTVMTSLQAIDRRLIEHDIAIKNETQNLWNLAIAVGLDLTRSPVPPIIDNWIVIMHRFNGSINFNRSWIEYRNGFGDTERGEFWLGNEKIHRMTNRFPYVLRIQVQLKANGVWYHADYSTFSLDSETNKYALRLSGFSGGDAGDSLTSNSMSSYGFLGGMNFTTWDEDNDRNGGNCASAKGGGWWFNNCEWACLTCQYNSYSFRWYSLDHVSSGGRLRAARMMIRSK